MKESNKIDIKLLFSLFITFFKIGAFTFGGGLAMLPILERELCDKKKWTTNDELIDYYSISQSTPGVIAVNVSTFVGFKKAGVLGGIFALLGIVTPSILIITLIATFISNFEYIPWVQKALKGINISVAALLTFSVFKLSKKNLSKWWSYFLYFGAFILIYFFKVHTCVVILLGVIVGIILYFVNKKQIQKEEP